MIRALCLALLLAGCAAQPNAGGGQLTTESGFSAFCVAHPHAGTCP